MIHYGTRSTIIISGLLRSKNEVEVALRQTHEELRATNELVWKWRNYLTKAVVSRDRKQKSKMWSDPFEELETPSSLEVAKNQRLNGPIRGLMKILREEWSIDHLIPEGDGGRYFSRKHQGIEDLVLANSGITVASIRKLIDEFTLLEVSSSTRWFKAVSN
ncbi:hypothetical protein Tco_1049798 [Tanacetum coccineum]